VSAQDGLEPRLAAPPRRVPLSLWIWSLFGGPGAFIWAWLGVGSAVSIVAVRNADTSWLRPPAATAHAQGFVEECTETGGSEGGTDTRRGTPIYANRFRFKDPSGDLIHGVSYAPGRCLDAETVVDVAYDVRRPSASHIVGMRRFRFGRTGLVSLFFPLLGVVFFAFIVREARRSLGLLAHGRLARGRLVGAEDGGVVEDVGRLTKLRFQIEGDGAQGLELTTVTTTPPQRLKDEGYAWLLYDPAGPERGLVGDVIPRGVTVDPDGQLRFERPLAMGLVLLFPIAAVVAIAVTLTMKL
jgi:hypothetical protein